MKILVCFKAIEDIDKQSKEDWVLEGKEISLQYMPKILNCFDESALEMTSRLHQAVDLLDNPIQKTAFTVGNSTSERFLKLMLALKFDNVVHCQTENDIRFLPSDIAYQVAEFAKENNQDFIICGTNAGHGDNGQMPLYLAEMLEIPCYTNVIDFTYNSNNKLRITRELDNAIVEEIITAPAVLTIGNAQISYLRVPTLDDKMKAKKKVITTIPYKETKSPLLELEKLEIRILERKSDIIQGENVEKKTANLYSDVLKSFIPKKGV